jgi:hypothetical protein
MSLILPPASVIRVSRGNFNPVRFAEVEQMTRDTGAYLIPSIKQLPGLIGYYAAVANSGSMVHVSLWETDENAQQMGSLKEMTENARSDAEAVGVSFAPIVNFPIKWNI